VKVPIPPAVVLVATSIRETVTANFSFVQPVKPELF